MITPGALENLDTQTQGLAAFTSARGELHYLVSDPQQVRKVLIENAASFVKGDQEIALSAAIGWGLIAEEGETHRQHQAQLGPGLRAKALENYRRAVEDVAHSWIERFLANPGQGLVKSTREFAQESAEKSLFSTKRASTDFAYHEAVLRVNDMSQSGMGAWADGAQYVDSLRKYRADRKIVQSHITQLVDEWTQSRPSEPSLINYLVATSPRRGSSFSPVEQQASLFLQAATETTASLISWTLLLLANNPRYWDVMFDEVTRLPSGVDFTRDTGPSWFDAVLKESLRLYPPAWMLPRIASDDTLLGGEMIPRGARVVLSPWVTHRRADVFRQPREFLPERFMQRLDDSQRVGYFPFGLGTRICIGERYGMATARIFLEQLALRQLRVTMNSGSLTVGSSSVVLIPERAVQFSLG